MAQALKFDTITNDLYSEMLVGNCGVAINRERSTPYLGMYEVFFVVVPVWNSATGDFSGRISWQGGGLYFSLSGSKSGTQNLQTQPSGGSIPLLTPIQARQVLFHLFKKARAKIRTKNINKKKGRRAGGPPAARPNIMAYRKNDSHQRTLPETQQTIQMLNVDVDFKNFVFSHHSDGLCCGN